MGKASKIEKKVFVMGKIQILIAAEITNAIIVWRLKLIHTTRRRIQNQSEKK